ncbi:MAG: SpoIID/LytB domain-containing protein [Prevotella sp.]|nr:SpoIID/LytB domain-containing protein [Prevotella sp.]MCM1075302.1 SpoIID/LytB domain-containing protein [Ruminococcus sp.]
MNRFPFEPLVRVGLCTDKGFGLHPHGHYSISADEDMLTYQPLNDDCRMEIDGIRIGKDFHWDSKHNFSYPGIIQVLKKDACTHLINILKAEQYLQSVVGSEMHPEAPAEFVKAHSIIARSWLMRMLYSRKSVKPEQSGDNKFISWTDASLHTHFDICSDDHCQRYQGIGSVSESSRNAVESTRGLVLLDSNGEIADTRYSKCCGSTTELFSTCWADTDYSYLVSKQDPYCNPQRLKSATARHSHLLKDYDAATTDYYEWQETVPKELVRQNLKKLYGTDFGEVLHIKPLKHGPSGRIYKLEVECSDSKVIIGKELAIRKLLSTNHLLSSAFLIKETPHEFILNGRGWGHGVGLCQIGAAVMAVEGMNCEQILSFYYPGTSLSKIYD